MILNWHEHRPSKEIPPQWMWHLDHELVAWFEAIDQKQPSGGGSGDEEAPMMKNALTAGLRR